MASLLSAMRAEPLAIQEALLSDAELGSAAEPVRSKAALLINAILPDVLGTPDRLRRLYAAVGEWLFASPRSLRDVDEARSEFAGMVDEYAAAVARLASSARQLGLPADSIDRLQGTLDHILRLREEYFRGWKPFTDDEARAAVRAIEEGRVHDIDEVIRELQGPAH